MAINNSSDWGSNFPIKKCTLNFISMLEIIDFFNPSRVLQKVVILSQIEDLSGIWINLKDLNQCKVICLRAFHR